MSGSSSNAEANAGKDELTGQFVDFSGIHQGGWQIKNFDHEEGGTWISTDFGRGKVNWLIACPDHADSNIGEASHADEEEAVGGKEEKCSNNEENAVMDKKEKSSKIEKECPTSAVEDYSIFIYDNKIHKLVEVSESTHKMRWWDRENQVYVEHFSQEIEDALVRFENSTLEGDNEDGAEDEPKDYL